MFTEHELRDALCTIAMQVIAYHAGDITPENVQKIVIEILIATSLHKTHALNLHNAIPNASKIFTQDAIAETIHMLLTKEDDPSTLII